MKIIYSQLKKFLPDLKKTARKVANDLTLIGHLNDSFEKKEGEIILGLEVRQNRGDCLGYYGIVKELSALYDIPLVVPRIILPKTKKDYDLPIKVTAKKQTQRIMAIRLSNIKNSSSPGWLKKFLRLHEINSINLLVDLTNYIMFWYGIPCHAFDTEKSTDKLNWQLNNRQYKKFITLDATGVDLKPDTFLISSPKGAQSLIMIGGKKCAIDLNTKEVLIEMAIYDRVKVRRDYKNLNIVTDAGIRLEKDLDTELIPQALFHLINLVLKNCGGKITSNIYDNYLKKPKKTVIEFDLKKPSVYAGISISEKQALETLKKLNCKIKPTKNKVIVEPPTLRKDILLEEDLIEEIIRFHGYDKIPTNKPISSKKLPDITPKILYLIEAVKKILVDSGYDEIRSWPLIQEKYFQENKRLGKVKPIYTENSVNANFPVLRQTIISSLRFQKKQYEKYKLSEIKFFEVGKVFYQRSGKYLEHHSLGIYDQSEKKLAKTINFFLKKLGVKTGDCFIEENFAEINLDKLLAQISKIPKAKVKRKKSKAIHELTSQIISLDANVALSVKKDPKELIKKYSQKIGQKYLWQLVITDIYQESKKYKYTFRAYYYNTDDKTAKKIHLKTFKLA